MKLERHISEAPGNRISFTFEDQEITAHSGESVAAALIAADLVCLRKAETGGARGVLCGIGVCWECRCIIDGRPNSRACMTEARPGMVVRRQEGLG
jgi:predicted molibdopterin-dependent oxidoreductase YjgC